nr:hypothetical protein [Tanacetum cinerariifolium]
MRPFIIIDGAHLKGEFLGTMDGNNQILSLAYGVGKSETFRSWDWFLRKLKECIICKQDHVTIISDGAVSIVLAIKNVFTNAFHGRCYFEERFSTLRDWLPSIANKLDMIGLEKWARVPFPAVAEAKLAQRIAKSATWTRASYNEVIFDVGHPLEWDQPDGLITVLPPVMDKRQPGRPRNRDRFRSKGEQITPKSCTRCFKGGHNRRDCPSVVPSQIFIPATSSVKSGSSWNEEI